jgi:acetyltransferase-like isoleucine patch superfamily enzyme
VRVPETNDFLRRAGAKLHTTLWPESRAALRMPLVFDPPAPHEFAHFGQNSWVVPPATVFGAGLISVGDEVVVMEHVDLRAQAPLHLGDRCLFARFVSIWSAVGVHIGNDVMTSDYVTIVDCWHRPGNATPGVQPPAGAPIVIEDGAYLGCSSIIGPGVTIGAGAFIGEGSVVTEDVPAHSVVYGNPARITRQLSPTNDWQGDMFGRTA